MVPFVAIATLLVPLALAGSVGSYGNGNMDMMQMMQMMEMMQQYKNWGGNYQQGGMQQGGMQQGGMQQGGQQQQGSNQWWGMTSQDDYEAYLRWCEQNRAVLEEQEAQKQILEEIKEREESRKAEMTRYQVEREQKMRRESLMAEWKMWQTQLAQAEEFDSMIYSSMEMKYSYMFDLTMEFLKFCRCADDAVHLQRYLRNGDRSYAPGVTDAFNLDDLEGIDTSSVDAVAQRMATLSQEAQIKLFFGGIIDSMCMSVKAYVAQVRQWEETYNFMEKF